MSAPLLPLVRVPQSEAEIQANIRLAIGLAPHARLFRNNRGLFWAGKVIDRSSNHVTLAQPRQVEAGLTNGASDLIGWTTVEITPEMVGQRVALFTAGEVKRPRVTMPEHQERFIAAVVAAGGRGAVLRSEDDARRLVGVT